MKRPDLAIAPRLLRDPLLHFVVIGAALFLAWYSLGPGEDRAGSDDSRIVITQADLDHLKSLWTLQWKREPSPADVQAIVERYVRQEVFYREALKMELDHNDEIVRNRLAQKMEAVASDLSRLMEPLTEERLREYFRERADFFMLPQAYAFRQVLFPEGEADGQANIDTTLAALQSGADIPRDRRSKLSVKNDWPLTAVPDLDNAFGPAFSQSLASLPVGAWAGPVSSGYGRHLVYVEQSQPPTLPPFESVRDFVAREYEYQSTIESQDQVYRSLLENYEVDITAEGVPPGLEDGFADP